MTDQSTNLGDSPSWVGRRLEVEVGPVAHGGHCVARHDGRVIFVRHAIPGERVVVEVTEGHEGSRFMRADAVEVIEPSADRVAAPCPHAGPARCGGCDFQHVSLTRQRELKAHVVVEQLARLAKIERAVEVEAVAGDIEGLGWRTRVRFTATPTGGPGLRRHRSHDVEPIDRCLIAHRDLPTVDAVLQAGADEAEAVVTSTGDQAVVTDPRQAPEVTEAVGDRRFQLQAGDFWQVHPGAAGVLTEAVISGLEPRPGERCWDLYAGVGLFSAALASAVGDTGRVVSVESHSRAVNQAKQNLRDLTQVTCVSDRVERFVKRRSSQGRLDLVVLDPPRSGAGSAVMRAVAGLRPRAIAYVACDPASLARDLATMSRLGYGLTGLRAFDIFPMTHHVECVAILTVSGGH